jgi:DNA (cytosine-5)-methyltransferase 1
MRFFDFCSGIGGGRLGLELNTYECVGHADTSRLSEKTYKLLFNLSESTKNYGNIRRIKPDQLPPHEIMIAGFPCQSFSVIGRREGLEDKRGQLVFHLLALAKTIKPKYLIFENVRGLISHNQGKTLTAILQAIHDSGYYYKYKVLNSLDYGVPQMRQRIYIIGFRDKHNFENFEWPEIIETPELKQFLVDDRIISGINLDYLIKYLANKTNQSKSSLEDLLKLTDYTIIDTRMSDLRLYNRKVPTLRSQRDGLYYIKNKKIYEVSGYEALLLQGFNHDRASSVKEKVSNRHLLMQAGNAMTVNVVSAIGNQLNRN